MALILETGEGLPNADSLVSLVEVRAYADARGAILPVDDTVLEQKIRLAHDYLLLYEDSLQGYRRTVGQALPFPREGVILYNSWVATGTIPVAVKNVISQLVIEGETIPLFTSTDGKVVISETVGPISTTYAQSGVTGSNPTFPRVDLILQPLLRHTSRLTSLRV